MPCPCITWETYKYFITCIPQPRYRPPVSLDRDSISSLSRDTADKLPYLLIISSDFFRTSDGINFLFSQPRSDVSGVVRKSAETSKDSKDCLISSGSRSGDSSKISDTGLPLAPKFTCLRNGNSHSPNASLSRQDPGIKCNPV